MVQLKDNKYITRSNACLGASDRYNSFFKFNSICFIKKL